MTTSGKIVFSKEKNTKPEDLLKFSIHEQLAVETSAPEEEDESPSSSQEQAATQSSQRELEEKFRHQLKVEKEKLKESLQIEFARRSSIMEKEVKKVLLALLKIDPKSKKYLLKIQKVLSDFTKKTTED